MRALPSMLMACGLTTLMACDHPGYPDQQVGYRTGIDGGANTGERGTIKITEVLWSGSVRGTGDDAVWDPSDVFIELRNEGARPMNLSGWFLEISGTQRYTVRIPASDLTLPVGGEAYIAKKASGCFPEPDWVIPELRFTQGSPFRLTLRDADERLMEPAGSRDMPPFAGGYDLVTSRSMERVNLMFGGAGSQPQSWHHYNLSPCPASVTGASPESAGLFCFEDLPNNDHIEPECRRHTLASPGRPNSPDYSGAFSSGGFE